MRAAIHPLPHTSLWRGAQALKNRKLLYTPPIHHPDSLLLSNLSVY